MLIQMMGLYGTDIAFAPGLNVIRAPNTSGKSTCIQAIIYALGLEGMLGPGQFGASLHMR